MQFFLTYLSRTHAIIINKYHSIKRILIKDCLRNFIQTFGGRLSFLNVSLSLKCVVHSRNWICFYRRSKFYLLVQYFDRRRELANSVLVSSVSFGGLVLPPLYRYFLDVYGLRGTMLIVSGLMLNVVALAGLLKPPPFFCSLSESNVVQIVETYKYFPVPTGKKRSSSLSEGMLPGNGVSTFTEKEATWISMPDRLNAVRERNGLGLSQSMQNLGSTNAVFSLSQTQLEEVKSNNENIIDI